MSGALAAEAGAPVTRRASSALLLLVGAALLASCWSTIAEVAREALRPAVVALAVTGGLAFALAASLRAALGTLLVGGLTALLAPAAASLLGDDWAPARPLVLPGLLCAGVAGALLRGGLSRLPSGSWLLVLAVPAVGAAAAVEGAGALLALGAGAVLLLGPALVPPGGAPLLPLARLLARADAARPGALLLLGLGLDGLALVGALRLEGPALDGLLGRELQALLGLGLVALAWSGGLLQALASLVGPATAALGALGVLGWCGRPIGAAELWVLPAGVGLAGGLALASGAARRARRWGRGDAVGAADAAVLGAGAALAGGGLALAWEGDPFWRSCALPASASAVCAAGAVWLHGPLLWRLALGQPGAGAPTLRGAWGALRVLGFLAWPSLRFLRRASDLPPEARRRAAQELIQVQARRAAGWGGDARVSGVERLPAGRVVLVANHSSLVDAIMLLALPLRLRFLVKGWVWRAPVLGPMVRAAGYLLADGRDAQQLLEEARRDDDDAALVVFPEGRRGRDGRVARFHNGAFRLARELGCPVLPVALAGTEDVLAPGAWWLESGCAAAAAALAPLDPAARSGPLADKELGAAARAAIVAARGRLHEELAALPAWRAALRGLVRGAGPLREARLAWALARDPLLEALPALCPGEGELLLLGDPLGLALLRLARARPGRAVRWLAARPDQPEWVRAVLGEAWGLRLEAGDPLQAPLGGPAQVVLLDLLEELPPEAQEELLRRLAAALPPGGRLVLRAAAESEDPAHLALAASTWLRRRLAGASGGPWYRTGAGWGRLLNACGFAVESVRPQLGTHSRLVWVGRRVGAPASPDEARA